MFDSNRGYPPEQWERLESLIARVRDLARSKYGTDSYSSMGRLCGMTHETIRRYDKRMVMPYEIAMLESLVAPLGMTGVEALGYILGMNEVKDSRALAIAYVKGLDPAERMAFISEALAA